MASIEPVNIPHSYASCDAMWKMQKPLNWCVSRFTAHYGSGCESIPRNILQVIQCVAALFAILPCALVAGVGALVNLGIGAPKINWSAIGEAPPRIEVLDAETLSGLVSNNDVRNKMQEWFFTYVSQEQSKLNSFMDHVEHILTSRDNYILQRDNYILQNSKTYLKQIVHHLNEKQNEPKRQMALRKLDEAYKACQPTWLEGTKNVWNGLSGRDDYRNKLLGWVQDVKEEMIKEEVQINRNNSQWHGLSYARKHRGERYGLDMSLEIDRADNFMTYSAFHSPGQIDDLFNNSYTESRLINGVMTRMHMEMEGYRDYDRCHFIDVLKQAVNDEEFDVMGEFFETYTVPNRYAGEVEDYRINAKGVMVLLMAIGQLR